jgi:hypothetical protein
VAILPIPEKLSTASPPSGAPGDYLIFVGAPSHLPNRFAIEWIVRQFGPAYRARFGSARILLVGKGTEAYSDERSRIEGLGFVSDERLDQLIRDAAGLLCPIEHGSGIKIKLLDAISRGCPIFATEFSLRGYEPLAIAPLLSANDPAASAKAVHRVIADPIAWREQRDALRAHYDALTRTGKSLADLVCDVELA